MVCQHFDPEFAVKSADIIGLYLAPPEKALVLCVDEKPSIQALERTTGYVQTSSGKIVRGLKSTYKRHGTINLFAALDVATGTIQSIEAFVTRHNATASPFVWRKREVKRAQLKNTISKLCN